MTTIAPHSWKLDQQLLLNAGLIPTSSPQWRKLLSTAKYDFYQMPEYVELCAAQSGGEGRAFFAESEHGVCLIPLELRPIVSCGESSGYVDAISPYGYPGILLQGADPEAHLRHSLEILSTVASQAKIVSIFLRLHPLQTVPTDVLKDHGNLVRRGETVYIDTRLPEEEQWKNMRHDQRRTIRKLMRTGFETSMDDWSRLGDFIRVYNQTMTRVNASEEYFFPDSYYTGLRQALGDCCHLSTVTDPNGEVAAAGLITLTNGVAQFHLGGTGDEFTTSGAPKLVMDHVRRWAAEQNAECFHLGGGVGCRADSLFHFKSCFSPARAEFHTLAIVTMPDVYEALARGNPAAADTDFFPSYRAAVANGEPR